MQDGNSLSGIDLTAVSGLDLRLDARHLQLQFGSTVLHPQGERRMLDQVRGMLADSTAHGPDHLYTIYMDICRIEDRRALDEQGLLYGSVVYNHGCLGKERLRSQGHVHSEKIGSGLRYSEVFEFWTGEGYVYLQKELAPEVSRAYLVRVRPGDKLVIPFGWVHLVITLGDAPLSFGAWCARANHLEYERLRELGGPAHFVQGDGSVIMNPRYHVVPQIRTAVPADFPALGIPTDRPIYSSWLQQPDLFRFLAFPELVGDIWSDL